MLGHPVCVGVDYWLLAVVLAAAVGHGCAAQREHSSDKREHLWDSLDGEIAITIVATLTGSSAIQRRGEIAVKEEWGGGVVKMSV